MCACSGAIHNEANIGGADTLSLDARQRLLLVGDRQYGGAPSKRVRCAEPSPDSLVAMQSVLSASGNASNVGSANASGSGALAARTAESAASIGYRDSSIQMLRDAYFRLCEAYMNGVLSDREYGHMVENADAYLAVSSALQIIGSNPVAPAVAISAGGGTTTATKSSSDNASKPETTGAGANTDSQPKPNPAPNPNAEVDASNSKAEADAGAKKAKITRNIVRQYLTYRDILRRETEAEWRRENQSK
jgi:hypothetical protein